MFLRRARFPLYKNPLSTMTRGSASDIEKMSEKALHPGDPLPPANPDFLRLYSMRFCPFAQRTRIVLLYKEVPHEVINVNLRYKPDWFLARNPFGLVPVIEYKNKIVYESDICDELLDKLFSGDPDKSLIPDCPFQKSEMKVLMTLFDKKVTKQIYRVLRPASEKAEMARKDINDAMKTLEITLGNQQYFGGNRPNMLDFHVFPWFERFPAFKLLHTAFLGGEGPEYDPLPTDVFPSLNKWMTRIQKRPEVQPTLLDIDWRMQFFMSLAQKAPQYDIGLPQSAEARL